MGRNTHQDLPGRHLLATGKEPDEPVPPLADQVEHGTASRMSKVCPDRIVLDCFLFRW